MVIFPNAKINIGLQVLGKRDDGFHNLHTIFLPVNIKDALEIIPSENKQEEQVLFSHSGLAINGNPSDNLCVSAYNLLQKDFPELPPVQIHLHKCIPMGAGMGGGSADAAFTLRLLNDLFKLNINAEKLLQYALQLGSDCPFFLLNKPSFAAGRGELFEEVKIDLSACKIVLIFPGIHVSTKEAFNGIIPSISKNHLKESILHPINEWKYLIENDFEKPIFSKFPVLKEIKDTFYAEGALYASMSGSGSSLYGIFDKDASPHLNFPESYFCKWV